MKVYDCFMYFDEDLVLEVRLNLLDKYVDYYHTISDKSFTQLDSLTTKNIYNFPFWVNSKLWFNIPDSISLKKKYFITFFHST